MITVTAESIKDFMVCELYYKFDNIDDENRVLNNRVIFNNRYENTMRKVVAFFFYKKQSNSLPSFNALLNRWEKLWFPKDMTAYDIAVEQHAITHGTYVNFSNRATWTLEKFYNTFAEDERVPLMIDEEFLVPLADDIRLKGRFDLVLRDEKGRHDIYTWTSLNGSLLAARDHRMHLAAQEYAFRHRNDGQKGAKHKFFDFNTSKFGDRAVAQPSKQDIDYLRFWAERIRDTEHMVPRRGYTVYCKSCPFDNQCRMWNDWNPDHGMEQANAR